MNTGKRISQYINSHNMSINTIAEIFGITSSELSDILHGKEIDCISYYKLCKALNVPLEYFLCD